MKMNSLPSRSAISASLLLAAFSWHLAAQKLPEPTKLWTVGPLTKPVTVGGVSFGPGGAQFSGLHEDTQTQSIYAATRSMAFAGDRIVLASRTGARQIEGAAVPASVYRLLSLDAQTGEVKDTREILAFGSLGLFAANDAHLIVAGRSVMRLTPDLKDDGVFDYAANGHKSGSVENISPDGSTLGNATSPGFELIDTRTLKPTEITKSGAVGTSVNDRGFVTDNVKWVRDYPKDSGFVTYTDASDEHLLYHGDCAGRPQFLTNALILEPGCKSPPILDTHGNVVRTLAVKGYYSFAGVSQNGKRFALQFATFSSETHSLKKESFVIYSVETGEPLTAVTPPEKADEQSWTAFSPDGTLFVVGSPMKLALYRLP
jgi:hypothetical protein